MGSNKAIVCLTRGYVELSKYNDLILRNTAIFKNINYNLKYPLLIFHQGNITPAHQEHIKQHGFGQDIQFINISDNWYGGYEGMCRFQMYDIWTYCQDYEYILRIDEDCIIQKILYDPFDQIEFHDKHYLTSVFWSESHSETNATLPAFIQKITGSPDQSFYNDRYPYTNVCIARVSFINTLMPLLKQIAESKLQRKNRWGDLPVMGSLLNLYAGDKVGTMSGLSYYHSSHNVSINCE